MTVVDDQADYFQNSTWLTQSEQAASTEQEQERQDALHKRQHMQLNVSL